MRDETVDHVDVAALFRRHASGLRRFLISRGIEAESAQDMSQESFLRLLTRPTSHTIANQKSYLFRIAANLGVDLIRHQARSGIVKGLDAGAMQIADDQPSAERVVISRQEIAILAAAFEEIPPIPQTVFLARLDGMTFAQIERCHGVPLKTAFSQVMKVTLFLKARLDETQATQTPPTSARQS